MCKDSSDISNFDGTNTSDAKHGAKTADVFCGSTNGGILCPCGTNTIKWFLCPGAAVKKCNCSYNRNVVAAGRSGIGNGT